MNRIFDWEICLFFPLLFVHRINEGNCKEKRSLRIEKKGINLVIQANSIKCFNRLLACYFDAHPKKRCSAISVQLKRWIMKWTWAFSLNVNCNSSLHIKVYHIVSIAFIYSIFGAGTMHHLFAHVYMFKSCWMWTKICHFLFSAIYIHIVNTFYFDKVKCSCDLHFWLSNCLFILVVLLFIERLCVKWLMYSVRTHRQSILYSLTYHLKHLNNRSI